MLKKWQIFVILVSFIGLANAADIGTVNYQNKVLKAAIKYPVIFNQATVNAVIKSFIEQQQQQYSKVAKIPNDTNLPKTNQLDINYELTYKQKNSPIVSVIFYVNGYYRGAAHPDNIVQTFNFFQQKKLSLADIFQQDFDYLHYLSKYSYQKLAKKLKSDLKWLATGTAAKNENFQQWYFTNSGLTIVFQPYQVAAYFEGIQRVDISKKKLKKWIKPSLYSVIWPGE